MRIPAYVAAPHNLHEATSEGRGAVLLFDDRCNVCRRFVSFLVGIDRVGRLRIAPLQSLFGDTIRRTHVQFTQRDSALFVRPDGTILAYSDAILASLEQVGGVWGRVARAFRRVPRHLRDRAYTAFANRRNVFGAFGMTTLDERSARRLLPDGALSGDVND
jgi:predicted DCC family thiol-disulfide oxidoreductase YuxK